MTDESLMVRFYLESVWNEQEQKDVEELHISKKIRGQHLTAFHRKAREDDFREYPKEYEAYQRNQKIVDEGTPLSVMSLHSSRIESLKRINVFTVEQLANVPDQILPNIGAGARQLRKTAQEFLVSGADVSKDYQKEIRDLRELIEELRKENRSLKARKAPKKKFKPTPEHLEKMRLGRERKKQEKINESANTG